MSDVRRAAHQRPSMARTLVAVACSAGNPAVQSPRSSAAASSLQALEAAMDSVNHKQRRRQASAGGAAMALAIIAAWSVRQFGIEMPPEIVAAVSTVIGYGGRKLGE